MNIEDSVIILKNIKKLVAIEWKHYITDTELSAIETLLTAYEKEKERNNILLQCLKDSQERCENEHLFLGNPDM